MVQQSVVGHIAHAVALLSNGDHESALLVFDRAVGEGLPSEKNILSLIQVRTRHSRLCWYTYHVAFRLSSCLIPQNTMMLLRV